VRGGIRLRRLLGSRGMTRLVSMIGPVAVGVVVAFAWNTAATHQMAGTDAGTGVTPEVGLTVEQAAAQAWASTTPGVVTGTATGGPPRASGSARPAGQPRGSGRPASVGCNGERPRQVTVLWSSGSPGRAGQQRAGQHRAGQARGFLRGCPRDANAAR
jgi:hypothetical protein